MSINLKSEQPDRQSSIHRSEDQANEPSHSESDSSSRSSSNCLSRVPPWSQLPTEVWTSIAEYAFYQYPDLEAARDPYFVGDRPDLTLMKVIHQLRQILQNTLLPNTLMILVRHYNCKHCPFVDEENGQIPYTRFFASGDSEPWLSISKKPSLVSVEVSCDGVDCADRLDSYAVATLYSSTNKVNVITLSQLLMQRSQDTGVRPVIRIFHESNSYRGTQLTWDFLGYFASLIQPTFLGKSYVNKQTILEMCRTRLSWSEGAIANESFFRKLQLAIDNENVPIHKMIMTAFNFHQYLVSMHTPPPKATPNTSSVDLQNLIVSDVHGGCTICVIIEGLSEFILQQPFEIGLQGHASIHPIALRPITMNVIRKSIILRRALNSQISGRMRPWQPADIPFLIYHSAVVQSVTRFQVVVTISSLCANSSYKILLALLNNEPGGYTRRLAVHQHLTRIRDNLDVLFIVAGQIDELRENQQYPELYDHDHRRISEFVVSMGRLTFDIQSYFNDGGKQVSDLFREMKRIGRHKYRIPVVSDLDSLYGTYDCIRQA